MSTLHGDELRHAMEQVDAETMERLQRDRKRYMESSNKYAAQVVALLAAAKAALERMNVHNEPKAAELLREAIKQAEGGQ